MKASTLFCLALITAISSAGQEHVSLTNISKAISLDRGHNNPRPFNFSGQIIVKNPDMIILRDGPEAITISTSPSLSAICSEGDLIRISGTMKTVPLRQEHRFNGEKITIVGHADRPPAIDATGDEISNGKHLYRFVRVSGVVASVVISPLAPLWSWLTIRTPSGPVGVTARISSYPYEKLLKLIDAEVTVTGIVVYSWGTPRSLGAHISLRDDNAIQVTTPAPNDPFTAKEFSDVDILHRQRLSGTIVARGLNSFFISSAKIGIIQVQPCSAHMPSVGEETTVVGFSEMDPICLRFADALYRLEPTSGQSARQLPKLNSKPYRSEHDNGKLVSLTARVLGLQNEENGTCTILLEHENRIIFVDGSYALANTSSQPPPGSVIAICGICSVEFENTSAMDAFPRARKICIIPRSAEDLRIVSAPSWLTAGKFLSTFVALILIIVVILIWNQALRKASVHKGRELALEHLEHTKADLKVEERTRLAVELHDSISQTLTGVALQIDAAQGSGRANPTAAAKFLENARAMLASCRQELRCCIWDLKSRTFEEKDMTEALQKTLVPHLNEANLQVRFNVPRSVLSESSAHDILRIVRELVINAIRHGHAKNIRIAGECRDGTVRFSVRDDGTGFSEADVPGPAQGHFGLQGIRERIGTRNGELSIKSAPGRGTKVIVSFLADGKDEDEA